LARLLIAKQNWQTVIHNQPTKNEGSMPAQIRTPRTRRPIPWQRSLNLLVLAVLLLTSACRTAQPTVVEKEATRPSTNETQAPKPLQTQSSTRAPDTATPPPPTETPKPTPTSNGLPVDDTGRPLPPQVVAQSPAGGQELALTGALEIVFDQAMDPAATQKAWSLSGPQGEAIRGEFSWPNPRTLRFTPGASLKAAAVYRAGLGIEARSAQGQALSDPLSWQFQTVGELQVSQVFPADGSTEIEAQAAITVIFNRPVVPLVINEEQSSLPNPITITPEVSGRGEWINTSVYTFRPDPQFNGATQYTVVVNAGLTDAAQESQLAQDYRWSFTTTAPSVESLQLYDGTINPQSNLFNILLDRGFALSFFQPMDRASTEAALSITAENGEKAPYFTNWNETSTRVEFTPTVKLAYATDYALRLDASALAQDGGALREGFAWDFTTLPEPAIESIFPYNGTRQEYFDGHMMIKFTTPMNIESLKGKIHITPEPPGEVRWWYNEWDWSYATFSLQPSTSYSVVVDPGMVDIYGNPVKKGANSRFTTASYSPYANLAMPWEPALMRAGGPMGFYVQHTNVKSFTLKLSKITPARFTAFWGAMGDEFFQYVPPESYIVWQDTQQSAGQKDKRALDFFEPTLANGEPLEPGFYFLSLESPSVQYQPPFLDRRFLVVASANLTLKTTTNEALAWLTDLESGKPVAGAEIGIYDKDFKLIGSGTTDTDGLVKVNVPTPADPYEARYAMTKNSAAYGFASSQWGSGTSLYDLGIWSAYYAPTNLARVYAYTDRPLYRPGQPVYFKGIVRQDDDLNYSLPDQSKVQVRIDNYKETVYEAELPLSEFGSFSGEFTLAGEAVLGYYNMSVKFPNQEASIGGVGFSVAEYRKPEFQVTVTAEPADVLAGESFSSLISASYYSGGAVADAQVNWTLRSDPFYFQPPDDLSGYTFTDLEEDYGYSMEPETYGTQIVAEGSGQTDASGQLKLSLPVDLSQVMGSRQLTLEATLTDVSQNAVSNRATINAHRSQLYVGVRPKDYVGKANEESTVEVVAVDWDGNTLSGQTVDIEIVERSWYSVQEQDASGRVSWTSTVEEKPVTSFAGVTLDGQGKASVTFTPLEGGVYRLKVRSLDGKGNEARASAYLWVAGKEFIPWRQTNDRSFNLVADKKNYTPGETAEILIASPFEGPAYALITLERGLIQHEEVMLLENNSTIYRLPITPEMAPNAYVSVLVVKGVDEANPRPNFKMGVLELKVSTRDQQLQVEIAPDRSEAGPGDQVTYHVRTTDMDGSPVSAEVSLGLTDLATLSLMGPNQEPILDSFYNRRSLGVWTSVPLMLNLEDYNAEIQKEVAEGMGMGSGGGAKGEGDFGVVAVRGNFPDTAFWNAQVVTDGNGEATIVATLPDNLTTWRMDGRAVTMDTRVGQNTQDLISTKPLLVSPQTPRFFVAGDEVTLGAAIQNNTGGPLTVNASLEGSGLTLIGAASQSIGVAANSRAYLTWQAVIPLDSERVDLIFRAEGGGYQDASRPPLGALDNNGLPVYRFEARETVGTSGMMASAGTNVEAINLPSFLRQGEGDLTIKVSPSLAAGMTDGLKFLEHYPYECTEQTVSRFLPNVLSTQALKTAGLSDPVLEAGLSQQVNLALQRLYNNQNPDGGWSWWPGSSSNFEEVKSDPQTSAYVVLGLVEARRAGYGLAEDSLNRAIDYLGLQVQPSPNPRDPSTMNREAFILYVLARADRPNISATLQLADQRQHLALYARAYLADALFRIDSGDPRMKTLLADLSDAAILSSTGTHWEEAKRDPWNWNTDTRTTAIVLAALSQIDPTNPLNANAVRWLMSNRTDGHWQGTQETAWTIMALTNWMAASGELNANYLWAAGLNNDRIGEGTANAETLRQTQELKVNVGLMLKDQANRLAITRDGGAGVLYYTAHLNVSLPVESIQALDQGVVVTRSYYRPEDLNMPVSDARQGDMLLARLTVVVPNAVHYLVVDDPLPAGLEAVDQSLLTSQQNITPDRYTQEELYRFGWGWWNFDRIQMYDEKLVLSASYLPAGTYVYSYFVKAGTVGLFKTIPPTAQEFYFPEVYGRGEGMVFTVAP